MLRKIIRFLNRFVYYPIIKYYAWWMYIGCKIYPKNFGYCDDFIAIERWYEEEFKGKWL